LVLHRMHLGARMRDARVEVPLDRGVAPLAASISLSEVIVGRLTSPSDASQRAELQALLRRAIDALDPLDREILTLRHFGELGIAETAAVLGIRNSAASNRYLRALKRLKDGLAGQIGLFDEGC